ncbi:MAG TPA: hypothetical protein ENI76_06880 [Ignavibacteria bacterium]|nr:hypothetical protein [Ignavibacteria bacterium]
MDEIKAKERHISTAVDQDRFEQYKLLSAREGKPLSHIIIDLLDGAVIENLIKPKKEKKEWQS